MKFLVFTIALLLSSLNFGLAQSIEKPQLINTEDLSNIQKPQNMILTVQEDPKNKLGLVYYASEIDKNIKLISESKYSLAEESLLNISEWLTSSTQHHYDLFKIFSKEVGMSNEAKLEKAYAHDFAKLRDKSYFVLAKLYIETKRENESVDYLVKIVSSQPNSTLGKEAYKLLKEIKFVD